MTSPPRELDWCPRHSALVVCILTFAQTWKFWTTTSFFAKSHHDFARLNQEKEEEISGSWTRAAIERRTKHSSTWLRIQCTKQHMSLVTVEEMLRGHKIGRDGVEELEPGNVLKDNQGFRENHGSWGGFERSYSTMAPPGWYQRRHGRDKVSTKVKDIYHSDPFLSECYITCKIDCHHVQDG